MSDEAINEEKNSTQNSSPDRNDLVLQYSQNQSNGEQFTPRNIPITSQINSLLRATPSSSHRIGSTPVTGTLPRGDIGRTRNDVYDPFFTKRNIEVDDDEFNPSFEMDDEDLIHMEQHLSETRIWGTDVIVQSCMNVFRNFIKFYGVETNGVESFYQKQLAFMHRTGNMLLNLNCAHLKSFPPTRNFYQQLKQYPQELIPIIDKVVHEEYSRIYEGEDGQHRILTRPYGLEEQSRMRGLDPKDIEKLLCIKGMVIRCSSIIPDLKQAYFRCFICSHGVDVLIDKGNIEEPRICPQCATVSSMEIIHNRCLFTDKQHIRLQETPDEIPAGETPHTVTLYAFDSLVDTVRPGDRIEVCGIFRAIPHRSNPRMRSVKSIYRSYIDAIHFRRVDVSDECHISEEKSVMNNVDRTVDPSNNTSSRNSSTQLNEDSVKQFNPQRLAEFYRFAANGNTAYERLVKSFAPSVWEMDDVKRGLLCLLFGGTIRKGSSKQRKRIRYEMGMIDNDNLENDDYIEKDEDMREDNKGGVHQRGDINVLLCGDPGTSKSQLLSYVHKLTPRGIYTSGKGSSAVGLTASVMRDPETNDMVLESGALVLSDNGICCIDEFDKMSDQTRAILHEAMEQQTVSITKAGIIATLNARTSILASANPVQSRYNAKLSVVENIKLPPTLLSRFDLIYLILDKPNAENDRKLARHLVSLYYEDEEKFNDEINNNNLNHDSLSIHPVDQTFLRDYIAFARNNVFPEITNEAEEILVRNYVEMRSLGSRSLKTITATPRQLESLIRLSQALAKMRLSEYVLASDVLEATRLMKVATQTAATDPRTGTIDMDMITTGKTALDRDLVLKLADELRRFLSSMKGQKITVGQIRQNLLRSMNGDSGGGGNEGLRNSIGLSVTMAEVEDAVKELETEGILQFIERTQTVVIR